ncbi:MAG TPA: hypothetical protein VGO64_02290 [Candidatus Limnocylindrales bacterium]|jgi:hypothetical protein|nr:hypothetical protein [Candidatus Limnocylindrales bacterium]
MYQWIVLLHIAGAFIFVMSHGVAIWMIIQIQRDKDPRQIPHLLRLSSESLAGAYVGLLLLLIGGIWAGIAGDWFRFGWVWAALAILVGILVAMYVIAVPYFRELRAAVGIRPANLTKDAPDPIALADADISALAARAPINLLTIVGFGGLLVILWLMVVKPF